MIRFSYLGGAAAAEATAGGPAEDDLRLREREGEKQLRSGVLYAAGGGAAIKIFILFYNLHFLTPWLQYFDGSSVAEPKPVGARTFWTKPV